MIHDFPRVASTHGGLYSKNGVFAPKKWNRSLLAFFCKNLSQISKIKITKSFSNFLLVDGLKFKPLKKATLSYVIFVTVTLLSFRMMISKEDISFVFLEEIAFCRYLLEENVSHLFSTDIGSKCQKMNTPNACAVFFPSLQKRYFLHTTNRIM